MALAHHHHQSLVRDMSLAVMEAEGYRIAEFLGPLEASYHSALFLRFTAPIAEAWLDTIEANHHVDWDWRLRLGQAELENYKRKYLLGNRRRRRPLPSPTLHPRLLWRCASGIPLAQLSTPHIGPSTVLPNGNIAVLCGDGFLRIFDTTNGTFGFETAVGVRGDWIFDYLFYSAGHLVMYERPIPGRNVRSLHVWKLGGEENVNHVQLVYAVDLNNFASSFSVKDVAVAADGKFYILFRILTVGQDSGAEQDEQDSLLVQSYDVATGNRSASRVIPMKRAPGAATLPPRAPVCSLRVSGDHILVFRHVEEEQRFPLNGLGVYTLNRADDSLVVTSFLPCFERGEVLINEDRSKHTKRWIIVCEVSAGTSNEHRKIAVNNDGTLTDCPRGMTWGSERNEIMLATDSRLFVEHSAEEGEVKLDEYDIATGEKVRTLSTGLPRSDHMVASVLSNGKEVVCLMSGGPGGRPNVIQTFLH